MACIRVGISGWRYALRRGDFYPKRLAQRQEEDTADFRYVRIHGAEELSVSGYDEAALDSWATKIRSWADRGRDVFVYFDNDVKGRAPHDAMSLAARLGVAPVEAT